MRREEFSMWKMVLFGIYRGANGAALGAITFSGFWSILIGIPAGLGFLISGFFIGVVAGFVFSLLPGMLGGVTLSVWLYYDWVNDKFNHKKMLWRGAILGGFSGLIIVLCLHAFFRLPFEWNKDTAFFLPYYISGILFAVFGGAWTGKRLIKDVFDLAKLNSLEG